jgi:hypothetical protein
MLGVTDARQAVGSEIQDEPDARHPNNGPRFPATHSD